MNLSAFNPEFVRNTRIHLRPGRIAAIAVVCGVVSVTAVAYYLTGPLGAHAPGDGLELLKLILSLQIVTLLIGGGIYCLLSINREKDLNTFDFQRITRLTPFQLIIGKLFGAPVHVYFAFLCLMPVAILGASFGRMPFSRFVMIYVLVVLGSIAYHLVAILLSLIMERGTSAGGIVLFLILVGVTSPDLSVGSAPFGVHSLSPFTVFDLFPDYTSYVDSIKPGPSGPIDNLFGFPIPHFWVLVVLYTTLAAWFLLAGARNIKRDPLAYELYSPEQGLLFSLYLNLVLLAFIRWSIPQVHYTRAFGTYFTYEPPAPGTTETLFLMMALVILALFGLTLLRNRDQTRRHIRELGARAAGWWAAAWPAPYMMASSLLAGIAIVAMIQRKLLPQAGWDLKSGLLTAVFYSVWVVRDVVYLQWMNLRRVRRPMMEAILYMVVFYACASALFVPLRLYNDASAPYGSILIPLAAFQVSPADWRGRVTVWAIALALVCIECLGFIWLQRRTLQGILKSSEQT